ncbi:uncharacterized protein [Neodiprion pinetum]|uniref:uncharacterized protein n=1 Tax=Neodiprion pinetum TaxID=441929 RepID=UPI001EDE21FB|nr:uncharacterized protein LOC124214386 [Neodiprion pinetum]
MEFPPRENKNKTVCCVYGCNSKSSKNNTVRFYAFPSANSSFVVIKNKFGEDEVIDRRLVWIKALKIGNKVTQSKKVCSLHFTKNDFIPTSNVNPLCSHLKKTSVPSCNLPQTSLTSFDKPNVSQIQSRNERQRQRSLKKKSSIITDTFEGISTATRDDPLDQTQDNPCNVDPCSGDQFNVEVTTEDLLLLSNTVSVDNVTRSENSLPIIHLDVAIQVESDYLTPKLSSKIKTDKQLSTLTELSNFQILFTIEKLIIKAQSMRRISIACITFNLRELIIMTFMKLKQNMSYATLAIFFEVSSQACKELIWKMIDILYVVLKPSIRWPSKENILKNIPLCFKDFEQVRVVVDCTEIKIQKPSKLCCQLQAYSYYKSTYTIKFMTGVTPAGLISFVSLPYGGRVSDNAIFEQSNIITMMDKKDIVLADKGFTMNEFCRKHDITLCTPFFLRDKQQFSKSEANMNRYVAKARVHFERSNQRLKAFDVLGTTMPACLMSKVKEIFTIICGVVNMSAPILKKDKFYS